MERSGHETDAEERHGVCPFRDGEQVEEGRVVAVLVEHGRAAVSTIQHVVGHLSTRNVRQKKTMVRQTGARRK